MFCGNCGYNVEDGAFVCPGCGAALVAPENTEAPVCEGAEAVAAESVDLEAKKAKKKKLIKGLIIAGVSVFVVMLAVLGLIIAGVVSLLNPANKVIKALDEGRYIYAVTVYEDDMDGEPNKKLIKKLDERLDNIWTEYQSNTYYYSTAVNELEAIDAMDIPELSAKLEEVEVNVETLYDSREAFEDAQYELGYEDYEDALYYFSKVADIDANYETAQSEISRITPIYKQEVYDAVDEALANEDYSEVFEELLEAQESLPNDAEITQKIADNEADVIKKADEFFKAKKYEEAADILEDAIAGYPDSEKLTSKLETIKANTPVDMRALRVFMNYENYYSTKKELKDAKNNTYSGGFVFDPGRDDSATALVEFKLDGEYKKFTAEFVADEKTNPKDKFEIEISLDGKVLKTIKNFGKNSKSVPVEFDITNGQRLKVQVKSTEWNSYNYINMVNAYVTEKK